MAVSSHCKGDAFPLATLSLARLQVDPIGHRSDWLQRRLESGESDTLSHGMEAADQTPQPWLSSSSRCNIGYQLDGPSSTRTASTRVLLFPAAGGANCSAKWWWEEVI